MQSTNKYTMQIFKQIYHANLQRNILCKSSNKYTVQFYKEILPCKSSNKYTVQIFKQIYHANLQRNSCILFMACSLPYMLSLSRKVLEK